jgi:hypothetical protein
MKKYSWTIPTVAAVGFYLWDMKGLAYSLAGLSVVLLLIALVAGSAAKRGADDPRDRSSD